MGYKRLFLADLTDLHLTQMLRAVESTTGATVPIWLESIADGSLEVYDLEVGIIGLRQGQSSIFVEFLVGKGFWPEKCWEAKAWLMELAAGRWIELSTRKPALVRAYRRLGFVPFAVSMRM